MSHSFWQDRIVGGGGKPRQLSGKTPLLLDDRSVVWAVLEGRVEVYSVRLRDGAPVGPRRHQFTAFAGEVLPGLGRDGTGLVLQAVGLPGTQVTALDAGILLGRRREVVDAVDAVDAAEAAEAARLLDRFLLGLCDGLTRGVVPKPSLRRELAPGRSIPFDGTTVVRPSRGVWWLRGSLPVRPDAPLSLRYLGVEEVPVGSSAPACVLTPQTWVEAGGPGEPWTMEALDTAAVLARGELAEAFDRFAELYFRCLATELRLADVDVYGAMHAKNRASARARAAGLRRLDSVLEADRRKAGADLAQPLARACAVVARANGIRIPNVPLSGDERVVDVADAWGVKQRPVTLRDGWWTKDGGPLLGFLRGGGEGEGEGQGRPRPVALLQPRPGRYVVHDPQTGTSFPVDRGNAGTVAPGVISFYRPLPRMPLGLVDLVRYTAFGARRDFLRILACGAAQAALAVLPPVVVKTIFSEAIPTTDRSLLFQVVAILAVVSLSTFSISLTRLAALQRMVGRMDFHLEPAMWERLIGLPTGFHLREGPGELADRIDGLNIVRVNFCDAFLTTLLSTVVASVNVVMLFVYGPRLALPALGVLLLGAAAGAVINLRQVESWRQYHALHGRLTSMVVQFFSGIPKIRMSGSEDEIFGLWARSFSNMERLSLRTGREQNRLLVFNQLFPVAATMLIFFLVADGSRPMMDTGSFLAFLAAYGALQAALLTMTGSAVKLSANLPLYQRLKPLLETAPEDHHGKADPGRLSGRIELAQVRFRYGPEAPLILDGIDLSIEPGEFVALVGPSGSGKSTILRLLLGFETPTSGTVRYDDRNLADLNVEKLRRQNLGVVLQDSGLLPGTLLSNIVGTRDLSEEDAWAATRAAGLEDDLRRLPEGLQTPRRGRGLDRLDGTETARRARPRPGGKAVRPPPRRGDLRARQPDPGARDPRARRAAGHPGGRRPPALDGEERRPDRRARRGAHRRVRLVRGADGPGGEVPRPGVSPAAPARPGEGLLCLSAPSRSRTSFATGSRPPCTPPTPGPTAS